MPDLVLDDVSITYRTTRGPSDDGSSSGSGGRREIHAVRHVSLTLPAGHTLGIAGESGSGKSTLVSTVLRLLPANATLTGSVKLGDTDVSDLSFGQLRAVRWTEASIIFQGAMHSLNPVRTVGWQIEEALKLHVSDRWRTEAERRRRVADLLSTVDLPAEKVRSYPHELSGGQRQRVMIAMALACEPKIIIADEPTTSLDVIVQKQILDMIAELVSQRGISLLMISHDLSVLANACERIAVMRDGEVVETGPAHRICTDPQHPYTRQLAEAFPRIGDMSSRYRPASRREPHRDAAPPRPHDRSEALLTASGVNVTHHNGARTVHAVRDVDLTVHRGEILALVGQSGSGKTTLARALLGLQPMDDGSTVTFEGRPLPTRGRQLRELRRRVQLVMQDPTAALNPKLTVYESVAEGLRVQHYRGDESARVREALQDAELTPPEDFLAAIPRELSGGQRQRVVIAGALAVEPSVIVADEPVASLDSSVRGEILTLLLGLRDRLGLSALVITHDLGLAWNIADSVAVMHEGRIVEHGPVEQVLLDPRDAYTRTLLAAAPALPTGQPGTGR